MDKFIESLKNELKKPLPGPTAHRVMAPLSRVVDQDFSEIKKTAKHSAVLVLLYPQNNSWYIVLMERNTYNGAHSGQISFPGGRVEKEDVTLEDTALREFEEEMGVAIPRENIVGQLSELYIPPSNFYVQPYLAFSLSRPEFIPQKKEVKNVVTMPLDRLLKKTSKSVQKVTVSGSGFKLNAPAYSIDNLVIWGATAMMLSELEFLIKRIDS